MKLLARLLFVFAWLASSAWGAEAGLDPTNAWFKPALVENRSPLCSAVFGEANRLFYSPLPRLDNRAIEVEDLEVIEPSQDLTRERIVEPHPKTGEPISRDQAFVTTHGKKIYLSMRTDSGCGGACESQQMFASPRPFETPAHWEEHPNLSTPTPLASQLTLLKSRDGRYHVVVVADGQLQLFTLTENATWDGVCKVSVRPKDLASESDSELQAALKSIDDLKSTISPIRQDAGPDCGTMRAHERGGEFMNDAFERALYRPWTLQPQEPDADGSDRPLDDNLTEWSTLGFDEYAAVSKFRSQRPATVAQLNRFYARSFGWPQADAALAAERAVAGAVDSSFAFSSIFKFTDGSLLVRKAILENRPVAELEALNWRPTKPKWEWWVDQESVLSIAVNHPAALRWLLSKQLDPNHVNAFGKTPLMYATQQNALEAVRILLAHGANPNAATIFPEDTCTYTLGRANVTALHYAIRYGSAGIVQTLIDGGALPFVKTVEKWAPRQGQTPLEWLEMYASPNISDADRPRLAQLLSAPESKQLVDYSQQQILEAEKQYAAGDLAAARRSLKNALQANASNERALGDLSLVALRAGEYGESLEAATRLISGGKDARMIANAWFNVGLACERSGQRYLRYNDQIYCMASEVFPFLQSWLSASSRARAEKLEQLFTAPGRERCVVPQPDSSEHRYIFVRAADMDDNRYAEVQRVYVLHPAGSTVSAAQIGWNVTPYLGEVRVPRPITPRLVRSHDLGGSTLTVFESEDAVQPPVRIGGYKCF
jgi:hypothetical protein